MDKHSSVPKILLVILKSNTDHSSSNTPALTLFQQACDLSFTHTLRSRLEWYLANKFYMVTFIDKYKATVRTCIADFHV